MNNNDKNNQKGNRNYQGGERDNDLRKAGERQENKSVKNKQQDEEQEEIESDEE